MKSILIGFFLTLLFVFSINKGLCSNVDDDIIYNSICNDSNQAERFENTLETFNHSMCDKNVIYTIDNTVPLNELEKGHNFYTNAIPSFHMEDIERGLSTTDYNTFIIKNKVTIDSEVVEILDSCFFEINYNLVRSLSFLESENEQTVLFRNKAIEIVEEYVKRQERKKRIEEISYLSWIFLFIISVVGVIRYTKRSDRFLSSLFALLLIASILILLYRLPFVII